MLHKEAIHKACRKYIGHVGKRLLAGRVNTSSSSPPRSEPWYVAFTRTHDHLHDCNLTSIAFLVCVFHASSNLQVVLLCICSRKGTARSSVLPVTRLVEVILASAPATILHLAARTTHTHIGHQYQIINTTDAAVFLQCTIMTMADTSLPQNTSQLRGLLFPAGVTDAPSWILQNFSLHALEATHTTTLPVYITRAVFLPASVHLKY